MSSPTSSNKHHLRHRYLDLDPVSKSNNNNAEFQDSPSQTEHYQDIKHNSNLFNDQLSSSSPQPQPNNQQHSTTLYSSSSSSQEMEDNEADWSTKSTILLAQGVALTIIVGVFLFACMRRHSRRLALQRAGITRLAQLAQEWTTIRVSSNAVDVVVDSHDGGGVVVGSSSSSTTTMGNNVGATIMGGHRESGRAVNGVEHGGGLDNNNITTEEGTDSNNDNNNNSNNDSNSPLHILTTTIPNIILFLPRTTFHILTYPLRLLDNAINGWSTERVRTNGYDSQYFQSVVQRWEEEKEAAKEKPEEREVRLKEAFMKGRMVWEIGEEHFIPPLCHDNYGDDDDDVMGLVEDGSHEVCSSDTTKDDVCELEISVCRNECVIGNGINHHNDVDENESNYVSGTSTKDNNSEADGASSLKADISVVELIAEYSHETTTSATDEQLSSEIEPKTATAANSLDSSMSLMEKSIKRLPASVISDKAIHEMEKDLKVNLANSKVENTEEKNETSKEQDGTRNDFLVLVSKSNDGNDVNPPNLDFEQNCLDVNGNNNAANNACNSGGTLTVSEDMTHCTEDNANATEANSTSKLPRQYSMDLEKIGSNLTKTLGPNDTLAPATAAVEATTSSITTPFDMDSTPSYLYLSVPNRSRNNTGTMSEPTADSILSTCHSMESMSTSTSASSAPSSQQPIISSLLDIPPMQSTRPIPNQCAICLCDYEPGDKIVVSSSSPLLSSGSDGSDDNTESNVSNNSKDNRSNECPHAFHQECIVEWLVKMQEGTPCPCCRRNFVDLDEYNPRTTSNINSANNSVSDTQNSEEIERLRQEQRRRHIELGLQRGGRAFNASRISLR